MVICTCIKSDGKKCTREVSNKPGENHKFCWQHQKCKKIYNNDSINTIKTPNVMILPIIPPPIIPLPKPVVLLKTTNVSSGNKPSNVYKFVKNEILNNRGSVDKIKELTDKINVDLLALYNTKYGKALIDLLLLKDSSDPRSENEELKLRDIMKRGDWRYDNLDKHTIEEILLEHTEVSNYLSGTDTDYENLNRLISESNGPYDLAVAFMADMKRI